MNLGILLWNTCNAACAHCGPNSGPKERPVMDDRTIFALIDQACEHTPGASIGLSGGEAFVYFDRLRRIVAHASAQGAAVSINTNGYWGTTLATATVKLEVLRADGLRRLVVSIDDFHERFIPRERVLNVIRACKLLDVDVELQFVASKSSSRLGDFLKRHADELINIRCRELALQPMGRANVAIPETELILHLGIPEGRCPASILSVSAEGGLIPCCNGAGHLPSMAIGSVDEPLVEAYRKFTTSPHIRIMVDEGPKALLGAAVEAGYEPRLDGYVDQCHLCHDLFWDESVADSIKTHARRVMEEKDFARLYNEFLTHLGTPNQAIVKSEATAPSPCSP